MKTCKTKKEHFNPIDSIPYRMLFLIFWTFFCLVIKTNAQIPHGGRPLEQSVEIKSGLRSAVDYFVEMPSFDLDSVLAIDNLSGNRVGGLHFANTFFVNLSPENSGIIFHTEDGTKVWKVGIRSPKAFSINVLFSEFTLPEGAKVFLYNADRTMVLGAFTRENRPDGGEFSVSPVDGEELIIEYHEPADAAFTGKIRITEVNHDYRGLFRSGTRFKKLELPCIPDLSCNSQYDTIGRSVCLLIINGNTYCTGTLVNNTAKDGKPYLLTASHCLRNNPDLGSRVVVFLNYLSPHCDTRIRGSEEFSVSGSVTRALSNEVDFALMELTEIPPSDYRPFLAGWSLDTTTINDRPFTAIHHPFGEVKKYCIEEDSLTAVNWMDVSNDGIKKGNHWNVRKWETGHTWAGSSGAPIFDNLLRFRGGLTGGDSGGALGCGDYSSGDFFYRFYRAWDQFPSPSKQLKYWLDPLTPDSLKSTITTIDGMDPFASNPAKRISNIQRSDSLGKIGLNAPDQGSMFGHNSAHIAHFAEQFTTSDSSMILGVYIIPAKGLNNSASPVTIRIYKGGIRPGETLGKGILNPNYIDFINGNFETKTKDYFSNCENYLRFETPISVGKNFYVGYEVDYPLRNKEDSFYVYAAIREMGTTNTAFFKKNGTWYPYSKNPIKQLSTSLWIEPVISGDTITAPNTFYEEDPDSVQTNKVKVFYSPEESLIYLDLPDNWGSNTKVEIFNLTGQKVLETNISPPIGIIPFSKRSGIIFLVRLSSNRLVSVQKIILYPN